MSGFGYDKGSKKPRKGWIIRRTDGRRSRGVDMKRNGDERKDRNGIGNGITVSGTEMRGLVRLWEETAYSGQE